MLPRDLLRVVVELDPVPTYGIHHMTLCPPMELGEEGGKLGQVVARSNPVVLMQTRRHS